MPVPRAGLSLFRQTCLKPRFKLDIEVKYLGEMVADALILEK
jgi:hypothetical protein